MKKTLYPKTQRIKDSKIIITEKLDGSNLGIFKLNGEILIAQRNHIFKHSELTKDNSYKGLRGWLDENVESLDLHEGSGVFGEWIGMGCIKYGDALDKKFYIFAKANINKNIEAYNINYDTELFKYPFESQNIPECMGIVPVLNIVLNDYSVLSLDIIYDWYMSKEKRPCEGFIINTHGQITKYVRHKNGKLTDHKQ